ncbi:hypothetical protein [Pseudomonas tohonis]|uniref:hypothetical protein n=1 Tax=Pseudomonas tohonis TaxID=2725477 RepID=UPI001F3DE893|nr:hypothetical protein [Pseudomonas tohonis]GJN49442.1 hypothetical protein TUM20249_54280 [Pseudomonas tohonis]
MPRSDEISADIEARLQMIRPSKGFYTDLKAVCDEDAPGDGAGLPVALLTWGEDETKDKAMSKVTRLRSFVIEGVFPRRAKRIELERFHFDVLRALGWGGGEFDRKIRGQLLSDSAEIPRQEPGAKVRLITITVLAQYTEDYSISP